MTTSLVINRLTALLSAPQISTQPSELEHYGRDWTRFVAPAPLAVVFPKTPAEVQQVILLANELAFSVVPSGGRTGLSGGAMACNGEVVLSLERMNKILEFNHIDRTLRCQAGVVTEDIQRAAQAHDLFYPVDFASAGSSQIGGNISTNAGGIRVIRYGLTRDWVAGLTVVTGAGEILELNHGLVKNATGYDLRHLFIGAEGTLGIVVEATLRLTRPPQRPQVLILGVTDSRSMMYVLEQFRQCDLLAFEFFDAAALERVVAAHGLQRPFATSSHYYVLIEHDASSCSQETLMGYFEGCCEAGWVEDGVISQSEAQAQTLWALRERISETITPFTPYKNDISVRICDVPDFLEQTERCVKQNFPQFEVVWFGHIGDGNLHLNLLRPENMDIAEFKLACESVNDKIMHIIARFHGSVSAEHGIGLLKKRYLSKSRSDAELRLMRAVRASFDPNGVLNPGKLF